MRKVILLAFNFVLFGCENTTYVNQNSDLVSNSLSGSWVGELVQFTTKELEDSDSSRIYDVILLNCNGLPEIWLKSDDAGFKKIYGAYKIQSKAGNHLLSLIIDGGGWVETQTWSLVTINNTKASIQWSRMVSNPYLGDDETLRSFGQMGFGELLKRSNGCNIWDDDAKNSSEKHAVTDTPI